MEYLFKSEYLGNGAISNTISLLHTPISVCHIFKRHYEEGVPVSIVINPYDIIEQEEIRIRYFNNLIVSYNITRDGDHILLQINREDTKRDDSVIDLLIENDIILETIDINNEITKKSNTLIVECVLNKLIDDLHIIYKQLFQPDTEYANIYIARNNKYTDINNIFKTGALVNIVTKQKAGNEEDIYIKDGKIAKFTVN